MAFNNITNLNLGNLVQIAFSSGVRNQLSTNYREWENIKKWRVGNTQARELRFMIQNSYGPAAIQYRNPGTKGRAFPTAQQASTSEHTAYFKTIDATIEVDYEVYDRALNTPEKYAEPLGLEVMSKTTGAKRRIASDWYEDGTGVIGTVASKVETAINTTGRIVVTLNEGDSARGGIGRFEFGDLLLGKQSDGSARSATGGTGFYAYKVIAKNRKTSAVTLQVVSSDGTNNTSYTASALAAGDLLYRIGQDVIADLSGTVTADYGTLTTVPAGIESLAANDGRLIHGITMEGATAGTVLDAEGDALDANMFEEILSTVKVNVGEDQYKWAKACLAPESRSKLINSRETDRRFIQSTDSKRGTKTWSYVHGNDEVEVYSSEFVKKNRIYGIPEEKGNGKVFEFYGSDFKPVKAKNGDEFMLKPASGGGHENTMVSYLHGVMLYVCKHPAAVWTIRNFT